MYVNPSLVIPTSRNFNNELPKEFVGLGPPKPKSDILRYKMKLMEEGQKKFKPDPDPTVINLLEKYPVKTPVEENVKRILKTDEEFMDQFKWDANINTPEQCSQMKSIILKYRKTFGEHDYDVSNYSDLQLHIDTGDHPPIAARNHIPVPLAIRPKVSEVLDCMANENIIRKSSSPWAMPLMIVYKKRWKNSSRC